MTSPSATSVGGLNNNNRSPTSRLGGLTTNNQEDDTFLTGLRSDNKKLVLASVPGAGPRIVSLFEQLKNLAETLDVSVSQLLAEHEKDFFLAYKTHMYSIQKEFKALKEKADEEALKTRRDAKIQSLEGELSWFMSESLRLDELCKSHKSDLARWRLRAEALNADRGFLESQIKGSKRQNKCLRAAVERAQESSEAAAKERLMRNEVNEKKMKHTIVEKSEEEKDYLNQIVELQEMIKKEKEKSNELKSKRADLYSRKSGLEEFFLQCVDESRRQLSKGKYSPLVEAILSSEETLVFLYERLFPLRAGLPEKIRGNENQNQNVAM